WHKFPRDEYHIASTQRKRRHPQGCRHGTPRGWRTPRLPAGASALRRADVLVHAEEIVRVVAALDLGEAPVILAVGLLDPALFVIGHEVDIDAAGRERRHR